MPIRFKGCLGFLFGLALVAGAMEPEFTHTNCKSEYCVKGLQGSSYSIEFWCGALNYRYPQLLNGQQPCGAGMWWLCNGTDFTHEMLDDIGFFFQDFNEGQFTILDTGKDFFYTALDKDESWLAVINAYAIQSAYHMPASSDIPTEGGINIFSMPKLWAIPYNKSNPLPGYNFATPANCVFGAIPPPPPPPPVPNCNDADDADLQVMKPFELEDGGRKWVARIRYGTAVGMSSEFTEAGRGADGESIEKALMSRLGCSRLLDTGGKPVGTDQVYVVDRTNVAGPEGCQSSCNPGYFDGWGDHDSADAQDLLRQRVLRNDSFGYFVEMRPVPAHCQPLDRAASASLAAKAAPATCGNSVALDNPGDAECEGHSDSRMNCSLEFTGYPSSYKIDAQFPEDDAAFEFSEVGGSSGDFAFFKTQCVKAADLLHMEVDSSCKTTCNGTSCNPVKPCSYVVKVKTRDVCRFPTCSYLADFDEAPYPCGATIFKFVSGNTYNGSVCEDCFNATDAVSARVTTPP